MNDVLVVDVLEVRVLVDNVTDSLSSVPPNVTNEWPSLMQAGMTHLDGTCLCCAHHGLALVLSAERNGVRRTLLFDGGPEGYAVERNGERLGIDFGSIEAVVLSHGHWDHSGGLLSALKLIYEHNRGKTIPFLMHPGAFTSRAMRLPNGNILPFKDVPSAADLEARGARVTTSRESETLLDGMFYLSGEIPRVIPYEKGFPGHLKRAGDGTSWDPDPWIMDERYVAVRVKSKGLVIFTACSHAGVINVLTHVRTTFPSDRLHAIVGGFHLSGTAVEPIISQTVKDMKAFDVDCVVPAHCTGWRAVASLVHEFGEQKVVPSAVGRRYRFEAV